MNEIEKYVHELGSDSLQVFGGTFEGGANIQQHPDEIAGCINALFENGFTGGAFLEIGSAAGGNIKLFDHYFTLNPIVIIDNNKHHKHVLRGENLLGIDVFEVIGDSKSQEVFAKVKKITSRYDLMFIDGDHSYKGVSDDFNRYSSLLSKDGFLIFHDSVHWSCPGVKQLVGEIKNSEKYNLIGEFVSTKHQHPCGVVLFQKK